uniref:Uncharacterized protein n=1 Tax=Arundo donax TaxID=35708 RepID=A0A0A9BFX2_ARUDO
MFMWSPVPTFTCPLRHNLVGKIFNSYAG